MNRFYFSASQKANSQRMERGGVMCGNGSPYKYRPVFVEVGGEWKEYTEWMSRDPHSSNFDDAVVVYEGEARPKLRHGQI